MCCYLLFHLKPSDWGVGVGLLPVLLPGSAGVMKCRLEPPGPPLLLPHLLSDAKAPRGVSEEGPADLRPSSAGLHQLLWGWVLWAHLQPSEHKRPQNCQRVRLHQLPPGSSALQPHRLRHQDEGDPRV